MDPLNPKFCANCTHMRAASDAVPDQRFWRCYAPQNLARDLVGGCNPLTSKSPYCAQHRMGIYKNGCGEGGDWYVEKLPEVKPVGFFKRIFG